MKRKKLLLLAIGLILPIFQTIAQTPKYYDNKGRLIVVNTSKVSNEQDIDSAYIRSLPKTITLSNLTKQDLRVFKNLMLAKVQGSDKPYDSETKVVFDKIMLDLNTKPDTVTTFKIAALPTLYLIEYAKVSTQAYSNFVQLRQDVRQFLRIAENVQKVDTAFYFLSTDISQKIDKSILKKDIKAKQ